MINEQQQRKKSTRIKSPKKICKQSHKINNLSRTVYCEIAKPKIWQQDIYHRLGCHIKYGNVRRKHDRPTWRKTRVTIEESGNLTNTNHGNWHRYQKNDMNLHNVMLYDMDVIPGLHPTIFRMTWEPQKGFQVASEYEALILKKNVTDICFEKKMANNGSKGFLYWICMS